MKLRFTSVVLGAIVIAFLYGQYAQASELRELTFRTGYFINKIDPFFPEYHITGNNHYNVGMDSSVDYDDERREHWSLDVAMDINLDLFDWALGSVYWDNTINGRTTTAQFRYVAWEFELGHKFNDTVSVFYYHHSEHGMDIDRTGYPLHDTVGISLCLAGRDCN